MSNATNDRAYDYLVIGAGPAGLQLGYYLQKAKRSYLIVEAGPTPGTFFTRFPRHRTLISVNKIYTGYDSPEVSMRFDWNSMLSDDFEPLFQKFSSAYFPKAEDFVTYLNDFARAHELNIRYETRIQKISRGQFFTLVAQNGDRFSTRRLIVATGVTKPYIPAVKGMDLIEQYVDVSINPADFKNQRVLIIGKGNSAFETADNLVATAAVIHVASPNSLKLAWKTHFVGHLRAVNNNFLDTYQLKTQNAVLDATIEKIERRGSKLAVQFSYSHATGEHEDILYDRVIGCTGFRFDASMFDETCQPELVINNRFPSQTSAWESTNVPELYFAGTLTQARDFKKTNSGFIHGFRYNARALAHVLDSRYHSTRWPSSEVAVSPDAVTSTIVSRVNESSALWQQFGFLGDALVVQKGARTARYFREVPVDYAREGHLSPGDDCYVITLEFGHIDGDPFAVQRHPDPVMAEKSTFLHPVIRKYSAGQMVSELHLLEDLFGEWKNPDVHVKPLKAYLSAALREQASPPKRRRPTAELPVFHAASTARVRRRSAASASRR